MHAPETEFCLLYVTCPNDAVAVDLGKSAVLKKLAACANILPEVRSIYEWKGELQEEREVLLLLKTRSSLVEALRSELESQHPYEVPSLVALPLVSGNASYFEYIRAQTLSNS
jgi:periplasmic divalent cation tolerance protein